MYLHILQWKNSGGENWSQEEHKHTSHQLYEESWSPNHRLMESSQCKEKSCTCGNQLFIINWCEFPHALSLSCSVSRKLGSRLPRKQAACFTLSPDGHGNGNKEVPKSTTPLRVWDAFVWCLGWGKEGQEFKVSNAEKTLRDRNWSSQGCLSNYAETRDVKHEFCISQKWSYKRLSSYGLACCSWLYEPPGMQPWFEGCIVSFQSETSQLHMFTLFEVLFTVHLQIIKFSCCHLETLPWNNGRSQIWYSVNLSITFP